MTSTLQELLYQSESEYLAQDNVDVLKKKLDDVPIKLRVYKILRDDESDIFQHVADEIEAKVPYAEIAAVKIELKHWIYILRSCAMGMLMDDLAFAKSRILDWISGQETSESQPELRSLSGQLLMKVLQGRLSPEEVAILEPYLSEALDIFSQ